MATKGNRALSFIDGAMGGVNTVLNVIRTKEEIADREFHRQRLMRADELAAQGAAGGSPDVATTAAPVAMTEADKMAEARNFIAIMAARQSLADGRPMTPEEQVGALDAANQAFEPILNDGSELQKRLSDIVPTANGGFAAELEVTDPRTGEQWRPPWTWNRSEDPEDPVRVFSRQEIDGALMERFGGTLQGMGIPGENIDELYAGARAWYDEMNRLSAAANPDIQELTANNAQRGQNALLLQQEKNQGKLNELTTEITLKSQAALSEIEAEGNAEMTLEAYKLTMELEGELTVMQEEHALKINEIIAKGDADAESQIAIENAKHEHELGIQAAKHADKLAEIRTQGSQDRLTNREENNQRHSQRMRELAQINANRTSGSGGSGGSGGTAPAEARMLEYLQANYINPETGEPISAETALQILQQGKTDRGRIVAQMMEMVAKTDSDNALIENRPPMTTEQVIKEAELLADRIIAYTVPEVALSPNRTLSIGQPTTPPGSLTLPRGQATPGPSAEPAPSQPPQAGDVLNALPTPQEGIDMLLELPDGRVIYSDGTNWRVQNTGEVVNGI